MPPTSWRLRIGAEARKDLVSVLQQTRDMFGDHQVDIYSATLKAALTELEQGPNLVGSASRDEIAQGLRSLHIARHRRRGRHLILYRAGEGYVIEIVRVLHDAMDLARHVPFAPDDPDAAF